MDGQSFAQASSEEFAQFHWMMDMIQHVDVGVVVLDREFCVKVWNSFMESHSGLLPSDVRDKSFFELFSSINEAWFRRKASPVFHLRNRAFITWEQKPYLLKFRNYRPITGSADFMYQNITLSPIAQLDGHVDHISLMIYDVTDVATSKRQLESAQVKLQELSELDDKQH